nr:immunoglobulin light chain junction region [Macaca mulatta]
CQQGSGDPPTF